MENRCSPWIHFVEASSVWDVGEDVVASRRLPNRSAEIVLYLVGTGIPRTFVVAVWTSYPKFTDGASVRLFLLRVGDATATPTMAARVSELTNIATQGKVRGDFELTEDRGKR